ncbi:MAG: hydantoinase/oxoprolinase family protein [Eubacteriales bacterium]|nr:hydantoinase/oxoprolinase family protein [Eubacteriales bacterium]
MILAIDMGGTHIDSVLVRQGELVKFVKHEVQRNDLFGSIWHCLQDLLQDQDKNEISRIHLSTTVCTNAIVEGKVSKVGVILQSGPGINWDFGNLGDNLHFLSGSTDHRGVVAEDFDPDDLEAIKKSFQQNAVESLAIISKFSPRNPETEKEIMSFFADAYSEITLGHSLSGKLNYPRRMQTAYLNAAVANTFRTFARNMLTALKQENITAPIYILKADGGTVDLGSALKRPVETILSGPAASYTGISALFPAENEDAVLLDIGGTTTDIFILADGIPLFEPVGIEIDHRKTLVRAVYSVSIGLGGDSYIRADEGEIRIGPERRGPAVAYGGEVLTPTDALVYLGLMSGKYPQKAEMAIASFASELNMDTEACAAQIVTQFSESILRKIDDILERVNKNPVYTIKELLHGQQITPRSIKVIGGPAQALAGALYEASGLEVTFPKNYEIANAVGAALAKPTTEISLYANTERRILSIPELDIYESIDRSFNQAEAENIALRAVERAGAAMGLSADQLDSEITESSSFNMVRGFMGRERNIRVRAQIRPGLLYDFQPTRERGKDESE